MRAAEGAAGLGIEPADLGEHVREIVVVDAADLAQGGEIASGDQRQIGDHRLHRRIEAVQFAQLQRQAFGQVARADARRLEGLHQGDDLFDPLQRRRPAGRRFPRRSRADSRPRRWNR